MEPIQTDFQYSGLCIVTLEANALYLYMLLNIRSINLQWAQIYIRFLTAAIKTFERAGWKKMS